MLLVVVLRFVVSYRNKQLRGMKSVASSWYEVNCLGTITHNSVNYITLMTLTYPLPSKKTSRLHYTNVEHGYHMILRLKLAESANITSC